MRFAVKIGGMSCNHCKKSVFEALECLPDAHNIQVELGRAYLHADCAQKDVLEAIGELGFDVLSIDEQ